MQKREGLPQSPPRGSSASKVPPQIILLILIAIIHFMIMLKYYYFAVIRFEEVKIAGSERTKLAPVTHYGKNVYASAALATIANIGWICNHVGQRFAVCGFEHALKLDDKGIAQGYVDSDEDVTIISCDLKGAVALLKKNLKLCGVNL